MEIQIGVFKNECSFNDDCIENGSGNIKQNVLSFGNVNQISCDWGISSSPGGLGGPQINVNIVDAKSSCVLTVDSYRCEWFYEERTGSSLTVDLGSSGIQN
jgi:hypothetical protein